MDHVLSLQQSVEHGSLRGNAKLWSAHSRIGSHMWLVAVLSHASQVRAIGRLLGVPEQFIKRHPFPGPGMGVRILGDVTEGDRLEVGGEEGNGARQQLVAKTGTMHAAALMTVC